MSGKSLLPDSTWTWGSIWVGKVILGVAGTIFLALGQWELTLTAFALLLVLFLTLLFGERLGILPDGSERRRAYQVSRQRRPGESRTGQWWRLFRKDLTNFWNYF